MIIYNYFEIGQQKNIINLIGITTTKSEIINRKEFTWLKKSVQLEQHQIERSSIMDNQYKNKVMNWSPKLLGFNIKLNRWNQIMN